VLGFRTVLGLAVEERSIVAAEVRASGAGGEVIRAEEFCIPEGLCLDAPTELGSALRVFLRESRFSTKRAVIGLPARWVMARETQVPPASGESQAGVLGIQAEREFSAGPEHLAVDYVGELDSEKSQRVLLVATLREKLEQLAAMAGAAGLNIRAATPSALALASVAGAAGNAAGLILSITPGGVELTVQTGWQFHLIRHIAASTSATGEAPDERSMASIEPIADEVRRAVSLLPRWRSDSDAGGLSVWDGVGLETKALDGLGAGLGIPTVVNRDLSALRIAQSDVCGNLDAGRFGRAAALGLSGVRPELLQMDFLHSRLTTRKKTALKRRVAWAACLAATLLVAGSLLALDWRGRKNENIALRSRLDGMSDDIEAARDVVEKVSAARDWYDRRPRHLDCLRELTLAFPEDGRIWTSSLAVGEDMKGVISGKSIDEMLTLELLDALKGSGRFGDVKFLYTRGSDGGSGESSFAIGFTFLGTE